MTPFSETGLSKSLQMLGRYYVQYFNFCYRRTGTLWEGRYKATLIDSELFLLACMRYIELNPVRAGMVTDPVEYPWSSYRVNALGQTDELVTPHFEFQRLGTDDSTRQAAYRALFNQSISEAQIIEIRAATNKAWVLGNSPFKERIQLQLARRVEPAAKGSDRKSAHFKINRV